MRNFCTFPCFWMRNTPPIETINKKSTCHFQFLGLQFVPHLRILHVLINKGKVWNLLQLKWQKSRKSRKLQAFLVYLNHGKIAKWEYTEKCCEAWIVVLSVKSLSPGTTSIPAQPICWGCNFPVKLEFPQVLAGCYIPITATEQSLQSQSIGIHVLRSEETRFLVILLQL